MNDIYTSLFEAALSARTFAHAKYSCYEVGAAILDEHGQIHSGCNIENAAFPEGWCAETSAISHMIMGGGRAIIAACVVAPRIPSGGLCLPCGGCRQRLMEFGASDTVIYAADPHGVTQSFTLGELLPGSFAFKL